MTLLAALGVGLRVEGYLDPSEDPVATSMYLQATYFSRAHTHHSHTQEYDSHGHRDQSPRVSTSSLNVNVNPRNKRVSYHDGYSEPSQSEDEEIGKRDRNPGLERKAPHRLIDSRDGSKPPATRTLHEDTKYGNHGGSPYVPMS